MSLDTGKNTQEKITQGGNNFPILLNQQPMIKVLLVALVSLLSGQLVAQNRTLQPLVNQNRFWVNGGMKASYGGRSRIVIPVELPAGSVGVVYTISTQASEKAPLASSPLVSLLAESNPYAAAAMGAVKLAQALSGSTMESQVDVYLLADANSVSAFQNKLDGQWRTFTAGNREGFLGGAVGVDLRRLYSPTMLYLAVRNPQSMSGVMVTVDAVAIVEE